MPRERLGVAVLVPRPADVEVDGLRRALGDGALGRIASHITLVPPVNVPVERRDEVLAVLRSAAAATEPLLLTLGPPATFHPVNPVVYLEVGGDVAGLSALRDACFRPPLDRSLTHDFVPHVTVADEIAPERIPPALAALADYRAEVAVDRVHLLREEPGRLWRPLADVPFGPPAVVGRGGLPLELATTDLPPPDAEPLLAAGVEPGGEPWAVAARRDGEVVGAAAGWTAGPVCHVGRLAVHPEARRQGVGRHLVTAVEQLAARRGCAVVEADAAGSPAADALMSAAGWDPADLGAGWRRWWRSV
jgi:2'-5' RNA ligase